MDIRVLIDAHDLIMALKAFRSLVMNYTNPQLSLNIPATYLLGVSARNDPTFSSVHHQFMTVYHCGD
jgi:hypothetical protein